jgi:uncharacterized protein (TIGR03118 family)
MSIHSHAAAWCKATLCGAGLAAALVACGGGDDDEDPPVVVTPPVSTSAFTATALVADVAPATNVDANLVNAVGIAFNPTGFVWVANNGSSTSTLYDGNGVRQTLVVAIPAGASGASRPNGIVFNGSTDFKVTQNGVTGGSAFIFASENGTISGWSPAVNRTNAILAVDAGATNAQYKGLAIASFTGANYIYATDFRNGRIDVYDATYQKVTLPGGTFTDPNLPSGYAPFGIQAAGNRIYVSYAQRAATGTSYQTGAALGMINVFDPSGVFIGRLITGGALNAPWGMAIAPGNFGDASNSLLVANTGDGRIHAYNATSGALMGVLGKAGAPIVIDGLWGIAFGNGVQNQPTNTLYYTAGPGGGTHGQYGRIDVQ